MLEKLRRFFCRHDWRVSRFQALNGGTRYQCQKYGKYRHDD